MPGNDEDVRIWMLRWGRLRPGLPPFIALTSLRSVPPFIHRCHAFGHTAAMEESAPHIS